MSENKFPEGWDEARVQRLIAHYEQQTEDEAFLETAAEADSTETVMSVPHELVPAVRELIAKRHS